MSIQKPHPLLKAGLHWKLPSGEVQRQAVILAIVPSGSSQAGDLALIQYFEWMLGGPSTRALIPLAELATSRWVLYASVDEMIDHYERIDEPRNEQIRRVHTPQSSVEAPA